MWTQTRNKKNRDAPIFGGISVHKKAFTDICVSCYFCAGWVWWRTEDFNKTLSKSLLEKQFETFQNVINKKVIVYLKDFISKSHLLKLLKVAFSTFIYRHKMVQWVHVTWQLITNPPKPPLEKISKVNWKHQPIKLCPLVVKPGRT